MRRSVHCTALFSVCSLRRAKFPIIYPDLRLDYKVATHPAQHPEITTVSRDRQGVYAEGARRGAPKAVQVADRFHLVLNLTQAVERELAVNRRQLRIASPSAPVLPPSPTTEEVKSRSEPIRVRSSVMMHQMEVARQRRQQKLELFRTIKQMRGAGMKVNQIARQLGLCRRRIDKWIHFDELPERSRMQPRPGMPESFRDYLRQRWRRAAGMGARYWRRFGSSATSVATRDWQNSFRRGASQKQRPEGRFPRSPAHRNLKQQPRQDPDNCRRRWRRHC